MAERIILEQLNNVAPRMMAVGTLWSEVRLDDDSITYTEFKSSLSKLEQKGQAIVIKGEDRNKVKITQDGQARLA